MRSAFAEEESWYKDLDVEPNILNDLRILDGNAIGLHMLLQDMTLCPTTVLAATKRPWRVADEGESCVLSADARKFDPIAAEGGIERIFEGRWRRHPLSYLMEAAGDICYAVMDAVAAVDLRVITEKTCRKYLEPIADQEDLSLEKLRDRSLPRLIALAGEEFRENLASAVGGRSRGLW